ncbi:MAG: hypothetical protein ACI37S_06030 [Candidatus Gastranaerophilaceae bacterium]
MMVGKCNINLIKNTMAFLTLVVLFVLIFISNAYLDIIQLFLFPFVLVNDLLFAAMPISILLLVLFLGLTFISKNPKKYNLINLVLNIFVTYAIFGYDLTSLVESTSFFDLSNFIELYTIILSFFILNIANIYAYVKNKPKLYLVIGLLILGYFIYKVIHFIW